MIYVINFASKVPRLCAPMIFFLKYAKLGRKLSAVCSLNFIANFQPLVTQFHPCKALFHTFLSIENARASWTSSGARYHEYITAAVQLLLLQTSRRPSVSVCLSGALLETFTYLNNILKCWCMIIITKIVNIIDLFPSFVKPDAIRLPWN